jgi:hypothetical protein
MKRRRNRHKFKVGRAITCFEGIMEPLVAANDSWKMQLSAFVGLGLNGDSLRAPVSTYLWPIIVLNPGIICLHICRIQARNMQYGFRRMLSFTRLLPGWRLAFGIIGDGDMKRALAHMDDGTDKPKSTPEA